MEVDLYRYREEQQERLEPTAFGLELLAVPEGPLGQEHTQCSRDRIQ